MLDLAKSFQTSFFFCKIRLRKSRERASQALPRIRQKLEKEVSTKFNKHRPAWNTASLYDWRDEQVAKQYQAKFVLTLS